MSDLTKLSQRCRKRAEIRRQAATRKSVQEGKPDRIADLLEEVATELERAEQAIKRAWDMSRKDDEAARVIAHAHGITVPNLRSIVQVSK